MVIVKKPLILFILLLVIAVGGAVFFYNQNQNAQIELKKLKEDPRSASLEETRKLVSKIGSLIDLPKGEDPTVATVTDKERLKDQLFFLKAENGDKVLIYTQAKKAYLYRPNTNKVIDVAPVNIGTQSATPAAKIRVAIFNGTNTIGLTNTVEIQLKEKAKNVEVVAKENAATNDYTKTLVIDLSGNKKEAAEQLAKVLNVKVEKLPEGESRPKDADILVILGSDYTKR